MNRPHAVQTQNVNSETAQALARAYQTIMVTHTKGAGQNVFLAQIAQQIKHASKTNAQIHAQASADNSQNAQ